MKTGFYCILYFNWILKAINPDYIIMQIYVDKYA